VLLVIKYDEQVNFELNPLDYLVLIVLVALAAIPAVCATSLKCCPAKNLPEAARCHGTKRWSHYAWRSPDCRATIEKH